MSKYLNRKELFELFENKFRDQLGLELSDVVTLEGYKFVLKMELMALSIGSLKLSLSAEESGHMSDFLTLVLGDSKY